MMNAGEALFLAIVLAVFFIACVGQAIADFMEDRRNDDERW